MLILLGAGVGLLGTLIGAGGGFVLAPLLVMMWPTLEARQIAAVSLAVVFVNASVGSLAYWRRSRVDVKSGLEFAACAIPGAAIGVGLNAILPREVFAGLLGVLLLVVGVLLMVNPLPKRADQAGASGEEGEGHAGSRGEGGSDELKNGARSAWGPRVAYSRAIGLPLAGGVGVVSSLLGIGGGIIHVPAMVHLLRFPVHNATATSHFVLAITTGAALVVHIALGSYEGHWSETMWLALGVVCGSPIGAALSGRLRGAMIVRALAGALVLVGVRVLWGVIRAKV